jgi:hypothetical protein
MNATWRDDLGAVARAAGVRTLMSDDLTVSSRGMTQPNAAPELVNLEQPETWPPPIANFLEAHHKLFLDWESGGDENVSPLQYDRAIYAIEDVLRPYAIKGWHCTRLTDAEIEAVLADGMLLPDERMLSRRIDALVHDGTIPATTAVILKSKNQAHEENRAGRVWFCFFPPHRASEHGIGDFFRWWGGEALYNSHDRDPNVGPVIAKIGTPCLVEADVPIALLGPHGGLAFKVVRRFLVSRGYRTAEPLDHSDRITRPLPASAVRRIIRFPDADFCQLTGCDGWHDRLSRVTA